MTLGFEELSLVTIAQIKTTLITLTIVYVYFVLNRYITQYRTKRRLTQELAQHDNFAYGLSYAGSIFAFVLMASEVFPGVSFTDPLADTVHAVVYALLALIFLELGRFIHDRHILFNFDENKAINQKNVAGAIIDAASVIANAICVVAIYHWTGANTLDDLPIIILMYLICQVQLLMLTRWREYRYARVNQGESMQRTLSYENTSLSIQHAGYLIAGALAIRTTSHISYYLPSQITSNVASFILVSTAVMVATIVFSGLASKIVLAKINSNVEISHQDNVGIATIEFSVLVAISMVLLRVFS
ncbi:MAG: DUF350 domain-containing protein [Algicola sp.]|nr:DUF350 domain-containing protein [Algicola sp.]